MRYIINMFANLTRLKFVVLLFFILMIIPVSVVSADIFGWALHGSVFYFAANNGVDSDPAPIIPSGGFSFAFRLMPLLKLELTEDIYFTNYEYNSALGYPMACNPENRSAFVMGFVTGLNAVLFVPLGSATAGAAKAAGAFRLYGGPAADFRLVTLAIGLNHPSDFTGDIKTDARLQTDAIYKYFWEKGRWFMPAAGFGFDFPVNEKFLLGFDVRTWFPVYRLWIKDNVPAIDGWRFGAGLRFTPR